MLRILMLATFGSLLVSNAAFAYVGPGAGLSTLGALWGVLLAIVASIGFILLWPVRRMVRRRRAVRRESPGDIDPEP
ncbi:MAG: hypothetical protein AB7F08_01600 [Dongiaceae bacterium]